MNKENYNEPLYENLKLFNGLELVYRHPCLHLHFENRECANCKYGLNSNCVVHNEYLKIKKYLEVLEILKENANLYVSEINKKIKYIEISISTNDNRFDKVEEWLNEKSNS